MNSRDKGKRGELELAHYLTDRGAAARRGQQFSGIGESPDVVCPVLVDWHIEVKRTEKLALHAAMAQAVRDAKGKRPLVIHRRNRERWLVTLPLDDFLPLIHPPTIRRHLKR